jgi:hypothetical protein
MFICAGCFLNNFMMSLINHFSDFTISYFCRNIIHHEKLQIKNYYIGNHQFCVNEFDLYDKIRNLLFKYGKCFVVMYCIEIFSSDVLSSLIYVETFMCAVIVSALKELKQ